MVTSPELAAEYAKLIPYFDVLATVSRPDLEKALDTAERQSRIFSQIMTRDSKVYALVLGNDGHQGYYLEWCAVCGMQEDMNHSRPLSYP